MAGKLRKNLSNLLLFTALAVGSPNAKAGIENINFPDSGVWSQPRIYSVLNSKEVNYDSVMPGEYKFKTSIKNNGSSPESTTLLGEVTGPASLSHGWTEFNINPGSTSTRYWTDTISAPGNYNLEFSLPNNTSINRDFTVVPEPYSLSLLGLGALALRRRK